MLDERALYGGADSHCWRIGSSQVRICGFEILELAKKFIVVAVG